jgi:enoyl-CoA hydratase/carnithine racemase
MPAWSGFGPKAGSAPTWLTQGRRRVSLRPKKDSIVAASRRDDAQEGITAFAEKRRPQFCSE